MRTVGAIRSIAVLSVLACALPVCADQSYAPQTLGTGFDRDIVSGDSAGSWQSMRDVISLQGSVPDSLPADSVDLLRASSSLLQHAAFETSSTASDTMTQSRSADLRLCILLVLAVGAVVLFFTSEGFRRYLIDLYSPLNWS